MTPEVVRSLVVVRAHVLLVGAYWLLTLGPLAGPQAADVILRWRNEPTDLVAAVVFTLSFSAVTGASCWRLLELAGQPRRTCFPLARLGALGATLTVAAGVAVWRCGCGEGLLVLGSCSCRSPSCRCRSRASSPPSSSP